MIGLITGKSFAEFDSSTRQQQAPHDRKNELQLAGEYLGVICGGRGGSSWAAAREARSNAFFGVYGCI